MLPEQVSAGARTVIHLAGYFNELKQKALNLLESDHASQRGFFSPSEDEQVRQLLVSYWQSRNALIELVVLFHDDDELPDDIRPAGFLIAFAGALVLVDAARFLRDQFHDRPVVREKLNEPEPHFGIPEGTYDRIQKSLTSPVHAWHLYHAAHYFESHQELLRRVAREEQLVGLLDIVGQLKGRLDVSPRQYAVARFRARARQVSTTVRRDLLSKAFYGLQKLVSRLISDKYTVLGHRPSLPSAVRAELKQLLLPGDVLINRKDHVLTNYFLPGFWPHAALYVGSCPQLEKLGIVENDEVKPRWNRLLHCDSVEPGRVIESQKDGVRIRSLASPFRADAILVLRPMLSVSQIANAIARGFFHEGKPYDFDFDFTRSDRLVCTEVVYRSYEGVGGVRFELSRRAGRMTLAAEDLIRMALDHVHFEPVAVFAPALDNRLRIGQSAETIIRKSIDPYGTQKADDVPMTDGK